MMQTMLVHQSAASHRNTRFGFGFEHPEAGSVLDHRLLAHRKTLVRHPSVDTHNSWSCSSIGAQRTTSAVSATTQQVRFRDLPTQPAPCTSGRCLLRTPDPFWCTFGQASRGCYSGRPATGSALNGTGPGSGSSDSTSSTSSNAGNRSPSSSSDRSAHSDARNQSRASTGHESPRKGSPEGVGSSSSSSSTSVRVHVSSETLGATATESAAAATASAAVAVSAAAAAVVGAVAAVTPAPPPRATASRLLQRVLGLLRSHFLPVLLLYSAKDAAAFLLHRVTQRLTNHAAEVLLGTPTSTAGNPWWLYLDPAFIRAHPGYELIIGFFFLACLPFTIALNSAAFTAAVLVCTPPDLRRGIAARMAAAGVAHPPVVRAPPSSPSGPLGKGRKGISELHLPPDDPGAAALADLGITALPSPSPPMSAPRAPSEGSSLASTEAVSVAAAAISSSKAGGLAEPGVEGAAESGASAAQGPLDALRSALLDVGAVLPEVAQAFRRVWWADLHFNLRALPLQGLCLLVLPALWAVPRLMRIQLALPVAVLEGREGHDTLTRSSSLMSQSITAYGLPFAGLLALGRLLEYVQGAALVLIPQRWWREVVEIPLLIAGLFLLIKAAVHRLQDLLPLASYLELSQQEADAAKELLQLQTGPQSQPQPPTQAPTQAPAQTQKSNQRDHAPSTPPTGEQQRAASPAMS